MPYSDLYAPKAPRSKDGKYANWNRCDCCNKPVHPEDYSKRLTDYDTCGGDDDVGFILCTRKRCGKKYAALSTPERYKLFATARENRDPSDLYTAVVYQHNAKRHGVEDWCKANLPKSTANWS